MGDPRALRWVDARGRLNVQSLGAQPVEGGREKDGTPLFVARVQHGDSIIPGKVSEKLDGTCCVRNMLRWDADLSMDEAALVPVANTEITQPVSCACFCGECSS